MLHIDWTLQLLFVFIGSLVSIWQFTHGDACLEYVNVNLDHEWLFYFHEMIKAIFYILDFSMMIMFEVPMLIAERSGVKWIRTVLYKRNIRQRLRIRSRAVVLLRWVKINVKGFKVLPKTLQTSWKSIRLDPGVYILIEKLIHSGCLDIWLTIMRGMEFVTILTF